MNRFFKVLVGLVVVVVFLGFGIAYFGERWLNSHLEKILNQNPERVYEFKLGEVDLNFFAKSIILEDLEIRAIKGDSASKVNGKIGEVFFKNVHFYSLFFEKQLLIDQMEFFRPEIEVQLFSNREKKDQPGDALQHFFGEILYKGGIKNFLLKHGNAVFYEEGVKKGELFNFGIHATELETDSIKVHNAIPFDYGRVLISFDSVHYQRHQNQDLRLGQMIFDSHQESFLLKGISLVYPEGLKTFARNQEYQQDRIEFSLDSLILSGLDPKTRLHTNLDIRAKKLMLFGLQLEDFRDKTLPRPKDQVKPMFQGMIGQIEFPVFLDTLQLINSRITYGESVPGKNEDWRIGFDEMNGRIVNLTTLPELQKTLGFFVLDLQASIQGQGNLRTKIRVPYSEDKYEMEVDFQGFSLPLLNEILRPILNGEIVSGNLDRLHMNLKASESKAVVGMTFDYRDLKVELFTKSGDKKNKLTSTLANMAIKQSNIPGEKRYLAPSYVVYRNRARGPFHLVWKSTKEGILQVIPGVAAKEFLKNAEKQK
jgi:hypothetical protein